MSERMDESATESKNKASFRTETIRGIVILFYKNLVTTSPRQFTVACSLCRVMAKHFNAEIELAELEHINNSCNIGYPLGLVQNLVYRDTMLGARINKSYNYGFQSKVIHLGDMILALENSMDQIFEIFTQICVDNDVDVSILFPRIEGGFYDESGI